MALPSTGANYDTVLAPTLDPTKVRYGNIVHALGRDYFKADGTPNNLSDPACGVGTLGLFTPFAADNISIREDLLWDAPGSNQGWFSFGLLKEDAQSITLDQTVQQTPSAQILRNVRSVLTKLEDKVSITPIESSDLINRLRFELPLTGWTPTDGTPGYQLARGNTDTLVERQIVLFLIDGDGQLIAEVYPRVVTDKKGKLDMSRKNPYSMELSWDVLPDPLSRKPMWICNGGSQYLSQGNFLFETATPGVTPITGLKATVVVPTPIDVTSPTYTVALQTTSGGSFVAGTVTTPSPSVSGAYTTITIGSLVSSQLYNALKITATGGGVTATTASSAPFTATAS